MKYRTEFGVRGNIMSYYMLYTKDDKAYVSVVDENGAKIQDLDEIIPDNDDETVVLEAIKTGSTDGFNISWGEEVTDDFCLNDYPLLIHDLLQCGKFVTQNMTPVEYIEKGNRLTCVISEIENMTNRLNCEIWINGTYNDVIFLDDEIAIAGDKVFYINVKKHDFHMWSELICTISREEAEVFMTLMGRYFQGVELEYLDYDNVEGDDNKPVPHMVIEKIDKDRSLYLKLDVNVSTMDLKFIKNNDIQKVAIANDLEKKVIISKVDLTGVFDLLTEITKVLQKVRRTIKIRGSFYVDEDDLIIMQERLAKEFVMEHLLQFASTYKIDGTDKLKKYSIRPVKPRLVGTFGESIDYLGLADKNEGIPSDKITLEIEGEQFSILDVIANYRNGTSYVSLSDNTTAIINKKYIEKLERLFDNTKGQMKLSFFDLPIIEDMIEEKVLGGIIDKSRDFYRNLNNLDKLDIPVPQMKVKLRSYQEYGYKWLSYLIENNLGGCLADDMGLGKTLQAITILTALHATPGKNSLVIMPKSLIYNWENEINKFSPKLTSYIYYGNNRDIEDAKKHDVTITTYGTVRNDVEILKEHKFDLIILDESQNIKNVNAQITKAVMLLNSYNRIALSGTPIENNLSELYSLFRFLNPGMFGSLDEFNEYYAIPIQKDNDKEAIEELRKKIYPFILRRVKKEVLKDLPDKIEQTMYIEMNPSQKHLYEERKNHYYNQIKAQIREQGLGKTQFYILMALNELRQITSCPELKKNGVISAKREVLLYNILEAVENGHKVLVFTNYIKSIENICKDLTEKGIKHLSMSGSTKDRQGLVDQFQRDKRCKVFIMTLKTGGVGLNLTAADTIFIYDPWWNKTVENQAIDRAYRLGQDKTVFSYKLILKDTIEEKIIKLQEKKTELLDSIISEDATSTKVLSEKDIEFIFR